MSKLTHHHHQQVDVAALTSSTELYVAYSSPTDAQTDIMLNVTSSRLLPVMRGDPSSHPRKLGNNKGRVNFLCAVALSHRHTCEEE